MLKMVWQWLLPKSESPRIYNFEHCLAAASYPEKKHLENVLNALEREATSLTTNQIRHLATIIISRGQAELLDSRFYKDLDESSRKRLCTLIETDPYILYEKD